MTARRRVLSVGLALHRLALSVPQAGWHINRGRAFCCPVFPARQKPIMQRFAGA